MAGRAPRSLRRRFGRTCAQSGGLLLLLSLLSGALLLYTRRLAIEVAERDVVLLRTADRLLGDFYKLQIAEQGYLTYANDRYVRVFAQTGAQLDRSLDLLERAMASAGERGRLGEARARFARHRALFDKRRAILSGSVVPKDASEYQTLASEEARLLEESEALLSRIVRDRAQVGERKLAIMASRVSLSAWAVAAALFVALGGLLFVFRIGAAVVVRLSRLSRQIGALGDAGTAQPQLLVDGDDEIGHLTATFNDLQARVSQRTEQLRSTLSAVEEANGAKAVLLGHMSDGLVTLDREGRMAAESSAALITWLGPYAPGTRFWDYIADVDPQFAVAFQIGWDALIEDLLPMELTLSQMPARLQASRGARILQLSYKPIMQGGVLDRLMMVLRDITSDVARERLELEQRELLAAIEKLLQSRECFREFVRDAGELVRRLNATPPPAPEETRRVVHTLKGNLGVFGLSQLSALCHEIEGRMAEAAGALLDADRAELTRSWQRLADWFGQLMGHADDGRLEIVRAEYEALRAALRAGARHAELLRLVQGWPLQPLQARLEQLAAQASDLGRRLGKEIWTEVDASGLRMPAERFAAFFSACTHLVRNAVDHGLEDGDDRVLLGKPRAGRLRLDAFVAEGSFLLQISDDGRGIDWERVGARARALGLPDGTRAALTQALFQDGLSTKQEISEISGRGVGLGAVRAECVLLAGTIDVVSEAGRGTTFQFRFPAHTLWDEGPRMSIIPRRASLPQHA